jgi:hypothetical protein
MPTKNKRKSIKVKINKTRRAKPSGKALEIDLKSAIREETPSMPKAAKSRQQESPSTPKAAEEKKKPRQKQGTGLQLNLYRKIAYSFIILTLALLAIIFYFSFIKVTITIATIQERISNNLIVDIYNEDKDTEAGKASVPGVIERIEVKETKNYKASGSEVIGEETTGKVTIINDYNKNQPLVATTRLLSTDNKLFRIKNTVNVPAGGTVEVEVYADQPGRDMAIGPAKFTIPGLWAGLQEKIYAESKEAMKYDQKAKKNITQADIDNGVKDIRNSLLKKAEEEVKEKFKDYNQTIYNIDEDSVSIDIDGKVGEEKDEFSITMTTAVAVVAFNDEPIKEMAREKLNSVIASDKKLIEFNEENITYSLDSQNLNQGTATINAIFEGAISLKEAADIIDREKILGLTREQLDAFLDEEPNIESYEVNFSPSFIDKVPNLADRVKVKVKD